MAEMSYQMLEVLSFCDRERAFKTSFNMYNSTNFSNEKKYNGAFCGVHFLRIHDRVQRNSFLQLAIRAS